jgi:hypothetical protein
LNFCTRFWCHRKVVATNVTTRPKQARQVCYAKKSICSLLSMVQLNFSSCFACRLTLKPLQKFEFPFPSFQADIMHFNDESKAANDRYVPILSNFFSSSLKKGRKPMACPLQAGACTGGDQKILKKIVHFCKK